MDTILEACDKCLWPHDITILLEKACVVCPYLTHKLLPYNVERWFPNKEPEFYVLGASLINKLAAWIGNKNIN